MVVKKKKDLLLDCTELAIWNQFKKYNKIKYIFLFLMGFFSGIILIALVLLLK
ncbi:hypothetical protein LCGC14_0697250 [marine sediment metagenome]|uniref:Uncharacterized protein n=1 Tax=marine sediment metagenome TaxID=412755 RepID=A0A0F9QIV8_9ZZZZ